MLSTAGGMTGLRPRNAAYAVEGVNITDAGEGRVQRPCRSSRLRKRSKGAEVPQKVRDACDTRPARENFPLRADECARSGDRRDFTRRSLEEPDNRSSGSGKNSAPIFRRVRQLSLARREMTAGGVPLLRDPGPELVDDVVEEAAPLVPRRAAAASAQSGGQERLVLVLQGVQRLLKDLLVDGDELGDGADVGLPAGGDRFDEQAGQLVLEAGDGDEVAWREIEDGGQVGGLTLVAAPPPALLHPTVGVEVDADEACDVLGGLSAGQAVFEQRAGTAHEFVGRTPQGACQGGELTGGGQGVSALPCGDVVGSDVGHAVRGAHAVCDVAWGHPELLAQDACRTRVEGEWLMHGQRLSSHRPQLHAHCRLHPDLSDRSGPIL